MQSGIMICLLFLLFTTATIAKDALLCRDCKDIQDPKSCPVTAICGQGEICETREFINHVGVQGFRVGCQSKTACDLLKFAQSAFGKRQILDGVQIPDDTPTLCHECCDTPECNANLCKSAVVHTKATPPPVIGHSATGCNSYSQQTSTPPTDQDCPSRFTRGYNDSCYLFGPGVVTWTPARKYCQSMGADLLVFNSKAEHDFWVKEFKALKATHEQVYWIGGTYNHAAGEWEWTDLSADHYTLWYSNDSHPTSAGDYYLYVYNPAHTTYPPYSDAEMGYTSSGSHPFICEKQIP